MKKASHIIENISKFEGLLHHVHTRFRNKIYRDHLDHMLRTALIASHIANEIGFTDRRKEEIVLAALFHDAGYPLQEVNDTLRSISESIMPYDLVEFEMKLESTSAGIETIVKNLSRSTKINEEDIAAALEENLEHAVIGAAVFLQCCNEKSSAGLRIASAICLHHSSKGHRIIYRLHPAAAILTIADELQDWGRHTSYPIGQEGGQYAVPMPKLEVLREIDSLRRKKLIPPDKLAWRLKYRGSRYPILRVIHLKYENLERLQSMMKLRRVVFDFPFEILSAAPFQIHSIGSGFEQIVSIEKKSTAPWVLGDKLSISDEVVEQITSMDKNRIVEIRKILTQLTKSEWDTGHLLWQCGASGNYLISEKPAKGMRIAALKSRFQLRLQDTSGEFSSGKLIFLNRPPRMAIPNIMRVLPVVLNVYAYAVARTLIPPDYSIPAPFLNLSGPAAEVFWFKNDLQS